MTPTLVCGNTIYLFLGVSSAGRRSDHLGEWEIFTLSVSRPSVGVGGVTHLGEREIRTLSVGRPSVGVGGVTPTSVSGETLTWQWLVRERP